MPLHPRHIGAIATLMLLLALVIAPAITGAQSTPEASPVSGADDVIVYELPGDAVYPEGVAFDASANAFYVGSTNDGTIFRGDIETGEVEVFSDGGTDGRMTAIGMEVDDQGRLFVAGGDSGQVFVYDTETGESIAVLDTGLAPNTFLNDVAVVDGVAYVTDSFNPILFQITFDDPLGTIEQFVDFTDTPFVFQQDGFNANGIEATPDGQYLIVVQSATGKLFRVEIATGEVVEVDLGGVELMNGDGMAIDGQTLYVIQNQQALIVPIDMAADYASGVAGEPFTNDALNYPTTLALTGDDRALVVNSQFGARESGNPELPFTVVSIPLSDVNAGAATPEASPVS
ncbi:MAG: SMP-30/gluconolactonase/LRE family protein [Thermomicrobiales bacterium]